MRVHMYVHVEAWSLWQDVRWLFSTFAHWGSVSKSNSELIEMPSATLRNPCFCFLELELPEGPMPVDSGDWTRVAWLVQQSLLSTDPSHWPPMKSFYEVFSSCLPPQLHHSTLLEQHCRIPVSPHPCPSFLFPHHSHSLFLSHCHCDLHFPRDWWRQTFSCAHWLLAYRLCKCVCSIL